MSKLGHFEKFKRQHAAAPEGGTPYFRDRYGRKVEPGCELDLGPQLPGGAFVAAIMPSLDPRHPPGALRVRLERPPIDVIVEAGKPIGHWTIIRDTQAVIAAGLMAEREVPAEEPVAAPEGEAVRDVPPVEELPPPPPAPALVLTDLDRG
jgi:hypothetical protein